MPKFGNARVLVAGDLMLDQYWNGSTTRISPEAPVPVVRVTGSQERLGGAANVALNLAALGCKATLIGLTGTDDAATRLGDMVVNAGISKDLIAVENQATITKLRIVSRHQQLIRMDFEENWSGVDKSLLLEKFNARLADTDLVILSDYDKGGLSCCDQMISAAKRMGKPVLVDPKGSSFEKYRDAWLVTPNLQEFELVVGSCTNDGDLEEKGEQLRASMGWHALLITLGERGMLLLAANEPPLYIAAEAKEVFDVTGAGDTVIAALAACIGAGLKLDEAAHIANIAAGIVVGKLGTATANASEIQAALSQRNGIGSGCLTEAQLIEQVAAAKHRQERIVMTNGCFDVLHAGHVRYLKKAALLGDRLVVAVNSDDSVRRLKGAARPLNSAAARMEVLAELACVDWVVEFTEDTPQRLIGRVLPDVLAKGGDYRAEDIAGYAEVTAQGGKVVIVDFEEGFSTTALIEKARQ